MTTRYHCPNRHLVRTDGNGLPTQKACRYCGAAWSEEVGTWGAFEWAGNARYQRSDALRTFASEKVADRWAAARELVVRWIPEITR